MTAHSTNPSIPPCPAPTPFVFPLPASNAPNTGVPLTLAATAVFASTSSQNAPRAASSAQNASIALITISGFSLTAADANVWPSSSACAELGRVEVEEAGIRGLGWELVVMLTLVLVAWLGFVVGLGEWFNA